MKWRVGGGVGVSGRGGLLKYVFFFGRVLEGGLRRVVFSGVASEGAENENSENCVDLWIRLKRLYRMTEGKREGGCRRTIQRLTVNGPTPR